MTDTRHPLPLLAVGIAAIVTDDGNTPETHTLILKTLSAIYERGLEDGADIAKVLSGKNVWSKRRPPYAEDPTSAYDS